MDKEIQIAMLVYSYHEIGHLMAEYICYNTLKEQQVATLINNENVFDPMTIAREDFDTNILLNEIDKCNSKEIFNYIYVQCCIILGGFVAEQIFCSDDKEKIKDVPFTEQSDWEKYLFLVHKLSSAPKKETTNKVISFLKNNFIKYEAEIKECAKYLFANLSIDKDTFIRIVEHKKN